MVLSLISISLSFKRIQVNKHVLSNDDVRPCKYTNRWNELHVVFPLKKFTAPFKHKGRPILKLCVKSFTRGMDKVLQAHRRHCTLKHVYVYRVIYSVQVGRLQEKSDIWAGSWNMKQYFKETFIMMRIKLTTLGLYEQQPQPGSRVRFRAASAPLAERANCWQQSLSQRVQDIPEMSYQNPGEHKVYDNCNSPPRLANDPHSSA